MAVQEIDADLLSGLKQAKGKRMYFAMIVKGGADGALIVSKQKVPPGDIAAAKKKCGGSAVIKGACFGEGDKLIFEVAKDPGATAANAVKLVAKRDAGLAIHPEFRAGSNPDLLEEGEVTESESHETPHSGATAPGAGATATKTGTTETKSKPAIGPLPETGKYEEAMRAWEQASAAAMSSIDTLVSALEATDDDLALAICGVIEQAQADFPDTLDEALTGLVSAAKAGKTADTEQFRVKSEIAIKAALAYLGNNAKTIDGCEHNPFGVTVSIRAPLTDALKKVLINVKK